jgi:hypothetical protein
MDSRRSRPAPLLSVILSFVLVIGLPAGALYADEPQTDGAQADEPPRTGRTDDVEGDQAGPVPPFVKAIEQKDWQPVAPHPESFDWIELKSGEWLKGEFVALYDDSLEFDSDELDLLTLDWADVRQVRSARVMDVGLPYKRKVTGRLWIKGDTVLVIGDEVHEVKRSQVVSITSGAPSELQKWSGKVSIGLTAREGNVDQVDFNNTSYFKRRTVENRLTLQYLANLSTLSGDETTNNQQVSANWDRFLTTQFYLKPLAFAWYRDPFQNISSRTTLGIGAGYQIIDSKRTDWSVSGGPGYQETHFVSVQPGEDTKSSTPAVTFETNFDQDWTKAIEFRFQYRAQFTDTASGKYNHHLAMTFETEWTKVLDFDLSLVWDRTEHPQADDQGVVPEQDDYRMIVGLGIEF